MLTMATILSFFGKGWERFLSIIVYLLVVTAILWAVYVAFVRPTTKPNPTQTVQDGGVAYTYNIKIGLGGCAHLPIVVKK